MGSEVSVKIIKPPIAKVTSGRIFRPSRAFMYKEMVKSVATAASIWAGVMISFVSFTYFLAFVEPEKYGNVQKIIVDWFGPFNTWTIGLNLLWLIPAIVILPIYIRSIEYSVKAESGETMPEIYVKKGLFTITRKHVPFRTITNISSNAGLFDRLFGIGNVSIETAGYSGASQTGPEEKLEGITFYEEVRDFILKELRRFKAPYTLGTEVVYPKDEPIPRGPGLEDEMLITLREIRDLLRKQEDVKTV
jgi:membrane protein YdbS with pleckstrin-like domain